MNRSTPAADASHTATLHARMKPLVLGLALACVTGAGRDALALPGREAQLPARTADFLSDVRGRWPQPLGAQGKKTGTSPSRPSATWIVTNCDDNGPGSLRDVVDHFAVDGDTIDMTALTCGSITLTTGSIITASNLTIEGPGTTDLIISGDDNFRAFVHLGSGAFTLRNLSIWHGYTRSTGSDDALGGGIASLGTVQIENVSVKYCQSAAAGTGFARGGGIFASNVAASSSMIKYNDARANDGYSTGGGVFASGAASFDYTTISGNQAFANVAWRSAGGGVLSFYGGALRQSTVSSNEAGGAGGVAFVGGHTAISQSTVSGNSATYSFIGAGAHVQGAFPVLVENSTITGNVERNPSNSRFGAGLHLGDGTQATVISSIVAGNRLDDGTALLWLSDINGGAGTTLVGDHNLLGWSGLNTPGDTLFTDDPKLGPLADNGGPTLTHALRPTSPAIEAGNNVTGVPVDQRGTGHARVIGASADIGAFEFDLDDLIFANGFD
jgi:hypothetical protein